MNFPATFPFMSRAIPLGESKEATQARLLKLLDEARAAVAADPLLSVDTLERMKVPCLVVLRIQGVLRVERENSLHPVAMAYQQLQSRPA